MTTYPGTEVDGTYFPAHLRLWTLPDSYIGESWPGYYVFLSQNRDSDALTRSNFRVALARLGGERYDEETAERDPLIGVIEESHWACGWVQWIAIHQDETEALKLADQMMAKLEDYPVLDEDDWGELEHSEAMEFWDSMSISERVDYCRDARVSVFAARRSYDLPDRLYDALRSV